MMNDETKFQKVLALVAELADDENKVEINEKPAVSEPTEEEISMNVMGIPDAHIRFPEAYAKRAKYYDPEREPFTATTWLLTAMGHIDRRPYKIVMTDNGPFRRMNPAAGPDDYWIAHGVSDITAPIWNSEEIVHTHIEEEILERFRNYKGGLRGTPATWPERYRKAYESTH